MGSESENEMILLPCLDFDGVTLKEGSESWKATSKKVIEACENHGFFLMNMCNDDDALVPNKGLKEEMFMCMEKLFELPEEIKKRYVSPKAYGGYQNKVLGVDDSTIPLLQTFRIDYATLPATSQDFTSLMWPQGNTYFCETLKSINSKMLEMFYFVMKMILEGYGLPQHYILNFREMNRTCDSRLTRYEDPENNNDSSEIAMPLPPHTDKSAITILYQNDVQGLQVFNKAAGKWIDVNIPSNGFAVIIGDLLKVWSNGRLEAAKHRVVIRGGKVRYSFVFFVVPDEDMVIKVPSELVDEDNMYPLRYRPFKYGEYLQGRVNGKAIKAMALGPHNFLVLI